MRKDCTKLPAEGLPGLSEWEHNMDHGRLFKELLTTFFVEVKHCLTSAVPMI